MAPKSVWELYRDAKIAYGDPGESPAYVEWLTSQGDKVDGFSLYAEGR
jgi:hypothetical protein